MSCKTGDNHLRDIFEDKDSREINFMTTSPVTWAAVKETIILYDLSKDLGVEEKAVAPVIVKKTRTATSPILPKSNRAESITGGLSKTGLFQYQ